MNMHEKLRVIRSRYGSDQELVEALSQRGLGTLDRSTISRWMSSKKLPRRARLAIDLLFDRPTENLSLAIAHPKQLPLCWSALTMADDPKYEPYGLLASVWGVKTKVVVPSSEERALDLLAHYNADIVLASLPSIRSRERKDQCSYLLGSLRRFALSDSEPEKNRLTILSRDEIGISVSAKPCNPHLIHSYLSFWSRVTKEMSKKAATSFSNHVAAKFGVDPEDLRHILSDSLFYLSFDEKSTDKVLSLWGAEIEGRSRIKTPWSTLINPLS